MNEREERGRQFIIASSNASEVFEALKKPLNLIAILAEGFVICLRIGLVLTWRNTGKSAPITDISKDISGVVATVGQHLHTRFNDIAQ